MGMILNRKIPMLKLGYPTWSDKYDVRGAVLADGLGTAIQAGAPLFWSTTGADGQGYLATTANTGYFAGVLMATNVKTPTTFPATDATFASGDAVNVMTAGKVAVTVTVSGTATPGKIVYVKDAAFTTTSSSGAIAVGTLTGTYEGTLYEVELGARVQTIA